MECYYTNCWVRGEGGNRYTGFTVCSSGLHWVISVEIYVILPEGFFAASLISLSDVACGLLFDSKILYKMQARVVHRDDIARGFLQASFISYYISLFIFGKFASFHLSKVCANFIGC